MAYIYSAPAENYGSLIHPIPRNEAVTKRISFVQNENFYKNCIKIHWRSDCNEEWLSGSQKKKCFSEGRETEKETSRSRLYKAGQTVCQYLEFHS